jgi:hypothetical protein
VSRLGGLNRLQRLIAELTLAIERVDDDLARMVRSRKHVLALLIGRHVRGVGIWRQRRRADQLQLPGLCDAIAGQRAGRTQRGDQESAARIGRQRARLGLRGNFSDRRELAGVVVEPQDDDLLIGRFGDIK